MFYIFGEDSCIEGEQICVIPTDNQLIMTPSRIKGEKSKKSLTGLIRQYFKKGSDFSILSNEDVKRVKDKLNNRPRKGFDFETPIFVMQKLLFNHEVAFVT